MATSESAMINKCVYYVVLLMCITGLFPPDMLYAKPATAWTRPIIPPQARGYIQRTGQWRVPHHLTQARLTQPIHDAPAPMQPAVPIQQQVSYGMSATPTPRVLSPTRTRTRTHTQTPTPTAHNATQQSLGGTSRIQPRIVTNRMIAAGGAEGYEVSFILSNDGYVRVYADNADDEQSFAPPINMNGVVTSVHAGMGMRYVTSTNGYDCISFPNNTGCDLMSQPHSTLEEISSYTYNTIALYRRADNTKFVRVLCNFPQSYLNVGQCTIPSAYNWETDANAVAHVLASKWHSVAAMTDGTVVAWGCGTTYPVTNTTYTYARDFGQCTVPSGLSNVTTIAAGPFHTLALKSDGTVAAWGCGYPFRDASSNYQTYYTEQCNVPAGLSNVVDIAAGNWHSLALKADGTVVAWGCTSTNYGGSVLHLNFDDDIWGWHDGEMCDVPAGLSNVVEISARYNYNLARKSDGTVACWPATSTGCLSQLWGDLNGFDTNATQTPTPSNTPTATRTLTPTAISLGLRDVNRIALSRMHRLAIKGDGSVVSSGCNGPAGVINAVRCTVPTGIVNPVKVAINNRHSLVLMSNGSIKAFGCNGSEDNGQCNVPIGLKAIDISAGKYHSAAIKADGKGIAWGCTGTNEVGLTGFTDAGQCVYNYLPVKAVSAGTFHTIWLQINPWDGNAYLDTSGCSSIYNYGQCDEPNTVQLRANDIIAVAAGGSHSLALFNDGTVSAWGCNGSNYGQCTVPTGLSGVIAIAAGAKHSMALKSDGTVVNWGESFQGQTTIPFGLNSVIAIAAGEFNSMALKSDGTLVCWGEFPYDSVCNSIAIYPTATFSVTPTRTMTATPTPRPQGYRIAVDTGHALVIRAADNTVQSYGCVGFDYGQCTVPSALVANPQHVSAGNTHSLALNASGSVVAWGCGAAGADFGQCDVPASATGVGSIAAGYYHSLATKGANNTVIAWGCNGADYGQCNVPLVYGMSTLFAKSIAAGKYHSLAVNQYNEVNAWGCSGQNFGQCTVPSQLMWVSSIAVAAGWTHSLALTDAGTVVAWGDNSAGQATVPTGLTGVSAIVAGAYHSMALKSDGTVVAWGCNKTGVDTRQCTVPAGLSSVVAIAAGDQDSMALKSDGTVVCWGRNYGTKCPNGTTNFLATATSTVVGAPTQTPSRTITRSATRTITLTPSSTSTPTTAPFSSLTYTKINLGGLHSCALSSTGKAYCWGSNWRFGTLGNGSTTGYSYDPVAVSMPGITFTTIDSDLYNSCGLTNAGAAYCWGSNETYGMLGDGTTIIRSTPVAVSMPAGVTFTSIDVGDRVSCALTASGKAYCWGSNSYGSLGNGVQLPGPTSYTPVAVSMPMGVTFTSISTGNFSVCAVSTTGAVYCWGLDYGGKSGWRTAYPTRVYMPEVMPGDVSIASIKAGMNHICAVDTNGEAYCWGDNYHGQFGNGTTSAAASINPPTKVSMPAGVSFASIHPGTMSTCARTTTGTVYCWGGNNWGQLGIGNTTNSNVPVLVPGLTGVTALAFGGNQVCALLSNNTIKCWGDNDVGQVGVCRLSPFYQTLPITVGSVLCAPTATSTVTPTATSTRTITRTLTSSRTATNSASATKTLTPSMTFTPSKTPTASNTFTPSKTPTASNTFTVTRTFTNTNTPSDTATPTSTRTPSHTSTPSNTATPTSTRTYTRTFTNTNTPSDTATASITRSSTTTRTETNTRTHTNTPTDTRTATDTATASASRTNTPTRTDTNTMTPSNTATSSATRTNTATATATRTNTPTSTDTPTASDTRTATGTRTNTPTRTNTATPTSSMTPSATATATSSNTSTNTRTVTNTRTNTPTRTDTYTRTASQTATNTNTPTNSRTNTLTRTNTFTMTATATATNTPTNTATNTPQPLTLKKAAVGNLFILGLLSNGTLVTWGGKNEFGETTIPSALKDKQFMDLATTVDTAFALDVDGNLFAWGGTPLFNVKNIPVSARTGVKAIGSGANFVVVIKDDGSLVTWGEDSFSQVSKRPAGNDYVAVDGGPYHACAIKADTTVKCWGDNRSGQSTVPVGLRGVVAVSAGQDHSVALLNTGKLVGWGSNLKSQIKFPTNLSGIVAVTAGRMCTIAVKSDGTIWATGDATYYTFGSPAITNAFSVASDNQNSIVGLRNNGVRVAGLRLTDSGINVSRTATRTPTP